jgi:glycosyltransferase EpsE
MKEKNKMIMKAPKISVIMGIYNCAKTLAESIDSLFTQTYKNFELIMCDDGSKDNTYDIAKRYADRYDNIVVLRNEENKGLNFTLNRCLELAKGEYIARQDGDDISLPKRFEKEIEILENNPNIALVSCAVIHFDESGEFKTRKMKEFPQKIDFIYGVPHVHGSSMFRKSAIDKANGYTVSDRLLRVEDYHLFFKMYAEGYRGYNIQEPLYKWRDDINAYKRRTFKSRLNGVYVQFIGFKMLKLPFYCYVYCIYPIIVYLLPKFIYDYFHRREVVISKNA